MSKVKLYPDAWASENTYKMYKLISLNHAVTEDRLNELLLFNEVKEDNAKKMIANHFTAMKLHFTNSEHVKIENPNDLYKIKVKVEENNNDRGENQERQHRANEDCAQEKVEHKPLAAGGMECKSNLSLELVQVLFRHGDRTPNQLEASIDDSDKHLYEPYGYAQLTPNGMRTVYKLGQMLRKRYNAFLQDYKPEHVWAFSSNTDRAKTSLDLVLAGLYPPTETSRWNDSLPWRPIPTHYSSEPSNYLMMPFSSIHFQKEIERVNSRPEVKKKWSKFERLIALLKDNTKLSFQNRLEILIVFGKIRNSLSMGGDLPRWMSPEALDELHEAAILAFQMMFHNDFLLRLNCGPMLKEIIARMSEHTEGRSERKIVLHSAHDINVAGFLHAYELDGVAPLPEYGAAVIVKKFRNEADERFVQLMYWTGVSEKLIPMKLPGCGSLCTVEHYAKVVEHLLPTEAERLE